MKNLFILFVDYFGENGSAEAQVKNNISTEIIKSTHIMYIFETKM